MIKINNASKVRAKAAVRLWYSHCTSELQQHTAHKTHVCINGAVDYSVRQCSIFASWFQTSAMQTQKIQLKRNFLFLLWFEADSLWQWLRVIIRWLFDHPCKMRWIYCIYVLGLSFFITDECLQHRITSHRWYKVVVMGEFLSSNF